jgi:hypothetical protein
MPETITTHTTSEGWPFNAGDPVWWHHPRGGRCEGFYLRLDIDDLEDCWGRLSERQEFLSKMEGNDTTCTECGGDLDDDGDCQVGCEAFPGAEHPQADAIRYQAANGVAARILARNPARVRGPDGQFLKQSTPEERRAAIERMFDQDHAAFEHHTEHPVSQLFLMETA